MNMKKEIFVRAGEKRESGEVSISVLPLPLRIGKGVLVGFVWALIAFVNALTPLVHLVLVPLSVIAGIVFSIRSFRVSEKVTEGSGTCPHCLERFETMTGTYTFPISDTCTRCGRSVTLTLQ